MTENMAFGDHEMRLIQMGGSFIAVKEGAVCIDDLLKSSRPGAIVRCRENPADCISVFYSDAAPVGCVAGWISEDE